MCSLQKLCFSSLEKVPNPLNIANIRTQKLSNQVRSLVPFSRVLWQLKKQSYPDEKLGCRQKTLVALNKSCWICHSSKLVIKNIWYQAFPMLKTTIKTDTSRSHCVQALDNRQCKNCTSETQGTHELSCKIPQRYAWGQ